MNKDKILSIGEEGLRVYTKDMCERHGIPVNSEESMAKMVSFVKEISGHMRTLMREDVAMEIAEALLMIVQADAVRNEEFPEDIIEIIKNDPKKAIVETVESTVLHCVRVAEMASFAPVHTPTHVKRQLAEHGIDLGTLKSESEDISDTELQKIMAKPKAQA